MNEPRIWVLPEEPPVGTVVAPARWNEEVSADYRRFKRGVDGRWRMVNHETGATKPMLMFAANVGSWSWVLGECPDGVVVVPDPSDPDGDRQELDALRRKVQELRADADKIRESVRYWKAEYERTESRRCELMLQMREVSLWNARIVRALLGSFDEKGDRQAQAAAAEQKARDLVAQRAHPAVTP